MAPTSDSLFSQSKPPEPNAKTQRRHRNLSGLLPVGLLLGFVITAWFLFGDRLLPARTVEVATVSVIETGGTGGEATEAPPTDPWDSSVLFQSSGWIEPDPFLIRATALVDGVVDEVFILEGQSVEKGQLLATLIDDDARLALAEAGARLAQAEAAQQIAEDRVQAARATLEARQARVEAAVARFHELKDDADRLDKIGADAVSAGEIRRAALRLEAQAAILESRKAEEKEWESELSALKATVIQAESRSEEARVVRDERQLALDRTRITSPIDGIVQRLHAAPGKKKMLGMDEIESATIATLYEPDSLQARIDVPLEQAASLFPGQAVWIHTNFLPGTRFRGKVTRIVGEADLQRNTLQAKVALLETDSRLRPEILCRAEFLASGDGSSKAAGASNPSAKLLLFLPESAVTGRKDRDGQVWVLSPSGETIERRTIRLGSETRDGQTQVVEGLRPGERVVVNPSEDLTDGERVQAETNSPSLRSRLPSPPSRSLRREPGVEPLNISERQGISPSLRSRLPNPPYRSLRREPGVEPLNLSEGQSKSPSLRSKLLNSNDQKI